MDQCLNWIRKELFAGFLVNLVEIGLMYSPRTCVICRCLSDLGIQA